MFLVAPARDDVRQAKKDEVPEKKRPKDALGILDLASGDVEEVERVKSFALPGERGGFAAWLHHEALKKDKDEEEEPEEYGPWLLEVSDQPLEITIDIADDFDEEDWAEFNEMLPDDE